MGAVANVTGEFYPVDTGRKLNILCTFNLRPVSTAYECHGSLIFDYSKLIWNEPGLSITFLLSIIFNHFVLPWVVLTAFQIHQNSSSWTLKHDSILF